MEDVSFFFVSKIEITRRTYIPSNHRRRSPWAKAWDTTTYMYSAGLVKKTLSTCGVAASAYRALVLSAIARPIPPLSNSDIIRDHESLDRVCSKKGEESLPSSVRTTVRPADWKFTRSARPGMGRDTLLFQADGHASR